MSRIPTSLLILALSAFFLSQCGKKEAPPLPNKLELIEPAEGSKEISQYPEFKFQFRQPVSLEASNSKTTACQGGVQLSADAFKTCLPMAADASSDSTARIWTLRPQKGLNTKTSYRLRITYKDKKPNAKTSVVAKTFTQARGFTTINPKVAALVSFTLSKAKNPSLTEDVTIEAKDGAITAKLPLGADLTHLTPEFTFTGTKVTVKGLEQTSGAMAQDFSNQVTYRVHAQDGSKKSFPVNLKRPTWKQTAYFKHFSPNHPDHFYYGRMSKGIIAVGAHGDYNVNPGIHPGSGSLPVNNAHPWRGSVTIFEQEDNGTWGRAAYIQAPAGAPHDHFGYGMAISGELVGVAAYADDNGAHRVMKGAEFRKEGSIGDAGGIYLYRRIDGQWNFESFIQPSNVGASDLFGHRLALDGDTLAGCGSHEDSGQRGVFPHPSPDNGRIDSGAIYIYNRDQAGDWKEGAYIKAANADAYDYLCNWGIRLEKDTLVATSYHEDSNQNFVTNGPEASPNNSYPDAGAAYVYHRGDDGKWTQQAYLKPSNPNAGDRFGLCSALSGDTLAIGAPSEDSGQAGITHGDRASADNSLTDSGAVYIYERQEGKWRQTAYIKAPNPGVSDVFGHFCHMEGNLLVIGAQLEDSSYRGVIMGGTNFNNNRPDSGAAYVYQKRPDTGEWRLLATLKPDNADSADQFGHFPVIVGTDIVVSAPYERSRQGDVSNGDRSSVDNSQSQAGAAYLFKLE